MRPVRVTDLPKSWQIEARRVAGMRPLKHRETELRTTKASIPATYGVCEEHGICYFPKSLGCARCEFPDDA